MVSNSRLPIDRGWAWVIVIACFGNVFIMGGILKSIGLLVEQFREVFHVSTALATMVMSVAAIVYAVMAPLNILLGEHISFRAIVMTGGVLGFIGVSTSSLLLSMGYVIVFFGIGLGLGNAPLYGSSSILIGNYFKKRRSLASGLALAGGSIGQLTLPPLIQFLLETYGLNGTLLLLGALYLHITLFGALLRPIRSHTQEPSSKLIQGKEDGNGTTKVEVTEYLSEDDIYKNVYLYATMTSTGSLYFQPDIEHNQDSDNSSPRNHDTKMNKFKNYFDFKVICRPLSIFYLMITSMSFFGYFNIILFLPLLVANKGVTGYYKALLLSICGIGDLIGRISSGIFGDLNLIQRYKTKAAAVIFVGVTILCFELADSFALLATLSGFYGFFGGIFTNLKTLVLIDFVGLKTMPKILAILFILEGLAASVGQPLLGWIIDMSGSFSEVIYICGILPLIGGILLLFYPFVKRRDPVLTY